MKTIRVATRICAVSGIAGLFLPGWMSGRVVWHVGAGASGISPHFERARRK
jgi:hypothetical protein